MASKKYDDKFREDVIEAVLEGHRSAAQVATDYDVPKTAFIAGLELTNFNMI
ncbi:MAG: hypothetical protein ISEC1_P0820 [Thiomicrorhabdus sp.]|nr:MAG: hypothetical protein ISEC1_P0820 [Thiomicrorhabdus sp.]